MFAHCAWGQIGVCLVGTGGPEITAERKGPATLITTDPESTAPGGYFLFDAGRNTLDGLQVCGAAPQRVTKIFLTHLHNDHIEGLPTLWVTPWFLLGRKDHLEIWGPPGTAAMVAGMRAMFAHDLENRVNPVLQREYLNINVHEIQSGTVYDGDGVRIRAVPVDHRDGNPAFAYRFEARGRSVLLTGDTTLTDSLLAEGKGVDVVIANVAAGTKAIEASGKIDPILAKLLRPEQAAKLFSAIQPRMAIYSHIVKKALPGEAGDAAIVSRTRAAGYKGPLRMGQDGMRISIGGTVTVQPPQPRKHLPDLDGLGVLF